MFTVLLLVSIMSVSSAHSNPLSADLEAEEAHKGCPLAVVKRLEGATGNPVRFCNAVRVCAVLLPKAVSCRGHIYHAQCESKER